MKRPSWLISTQQAAVSVLLSANGEPPIAVSAPFGASVNTETVPGVAPAGGVSPCARS